MSNKLAGKVALVTGGNSGIGLAAAQVFADEGAHVFITGRRQPELDEAVKQIGGKVTGVQGDVANGADLDRLFETIKSQAGTLDVVFANAGVAEFSPLEAVTEEHYTKIFDINVKGVLFTVQKALPLLKDGSSVIINASVAAHMGMAGSSVYSATKAAVRSFARTWTSDLKSRQIRVNVVSPGPIVTPAMNGLSDEMKEGMVGLVPLGRFGQPVEIARAALFLATDDSSYITGTELFVDGGVGQV